MCRPLFFHYENVAATLKENLPTPFGIFLGANAKPARGCWHELLEMGAFVLQAILLCEAKACFFLTASDLDSVVANIVRRP